MKEEPSLAEQYVSAFWDKFECVHSQVDVNRSEFKEFMGMIESRSKVEQKYSEQLIQLHSSKYENRSSLVGQLIKTYLNQMRKRAEQAKIFSNFLITEVAHKIRDILDGSYNDFKKYSSTGKSGDKELDRLKDLVAKNRVKHQRKRKELEETQLSEFVMSTTNGGGFKREQQRDKIRQKKVELRQATNELNKNIQQYNSFAKGYEELMKTVMGKYYLLERDRMKSITDSILKIQLTELSASKNFQIEVEDTARFIHDIDVDKEIGYICKNNLNKPTGRTDLASKQSELNFMSNTFERINSKELEQVLQYGKSHKLVIQKFFKGEPISQEDQQTTKVKTIANIFTKAWNGTSTQPDLKSLSTLMDNVFARKDFVLCMQQLRLMGRFEIDPTCIESIVKAVNIVLDSCLASKDGYTGKQIMVLVFTYFILLQTPAEGKQQSKQTQNSTPRQTQTISPIKMYLQIYVKSHSLWSEKDFWDSSFVESIYEQFRQHSKSQPEKGIGLEHEQNLVFNQLAYYVHNMVLFSIPEKEVNSFAIKFVKLYNLDEIRANFIYNNIKSSVKQENDSKTKIIISAGQLKLQSTSSKSSASLSKDNSKEEDISPLKSPLAATKDLESEKK